MTRHVYLTGFMGAGKTTVGRALAKLLDRPFVDLDADIEIQQRMTIAEIFTARGESWFRQLESAALRAVDDSDAAVVATGGGILSSAENREWIQAHGISVWLDVPFETIVDRLDAAAQQRRPLFEEESQARGLFEDRRREYRDSDLRIEISSAHSAAQVAVEIRDILAEESCAI